MSSKNIEIIDFKNMQTKTGKAETAGADFSIADEALNQLQSIINAKREYLSILNEVAEGVIEQARLDKLHFIIVNMEDVLEIEDMEIEGQLPALQMGAVDENYTYELYIYPEESSDDDEDGIEFYSTVLRVRNAEEDENFQIENYDFDNEKWVRVNTEDVTGYTSKQMAMLRKDSSSATKLLEAFHFCNEKIISDSSFEKLKKENQKLITLEKEVTSLVDFDFTHPRKANLIPDDDFTGLCVQYYKDSYCLRQYFESDKPGSIVYSTKSVAEMATVLRRILDRKIDVSTLVVVPLSDSAVVEISVSGAGDLKKEVLILQGQDRKLTQKELKMLHICEEEFDKWF